MSFMEKIGSMMQRPGQGDGQKDDVPWWMKYAGRGLGTVGSLIAIALGVWNCVGIVLGGVECFIGGIWQMLAGFIVILIEAPCCCMFLDFVQNFSNWMEARPYWNKGAFYIVIALPAIFLCPGLGSIFGSGLIFTTGVIYGLMALGKKASPTEMRTNAVSEETTKSTLVDNAQPMSVTKSPVTNPMDSGV